MPGVTSGSALRPIRRICGASGGGGVLSRCLSCPQMKVRARWTPQPTCGQFIQVGGGIHIEGGAGQPDDMLARCPPHGRAPM